MYCLLLRTVWSGDNGVGPVWKKRALDLVFSQLSGEE
jgi:hypothetical protein